MIESEAEAKDAEEALRKKEMEAEERRKQSHDLVAESIRRELAEEHIVPEQISCFRSRGEGRNNY